ncbi:uncharacterized protein [Halyomorpha halys]|uniref:uncharacterized protein isoform X2 n=2 Tax=Halyomorpha halys TaxID=286706 RepID=UPI0006D4CDFD|nr:uncharacterized protein LOC106688929 isoform X2 [Halyomorpha halys]
MEVIIDFSQPLPYMKYVFFGLICFSILRNMYEMKELNRVFDDLQTPYPQLTTKWPIDNLLLNLTQDDLELVGKLKSEVRPPPLGKYSFNRGEKPFKEHVLERAVRQFKLLGRGYFVEVGAGDGEKRSPTICLEIDDKWMGLLIEADLRFWKDLKSKRRKVTLGLSCVGLANSSYVGKFGLKDMSRSKLIDKWEVGLSELMEVNCYPLYTYLLAVGRTEVDFLVININGQELKVLQSLPWDKVTIHMIAVCYGMKRERVEASDYLSGKGYRLHRKYHQEGESFLMFVKKNKYP